MASRFGFAGAYTDPETGLLFLNARYYDPNVGEFITVDPLVNLTNQDYSYASDDPVNENDPSGMCSIFGNCFSDLVHTVASVPPVVAPALDMTANLICVVATGPACAGALPVNFVLQQGFTMARAYSRPGYNWKASEAETFALTGLSGTRYAAVELSGLGWGGRAALGATMGASGWLLDSAQIANAQDLMASGAECL